MAFRPQAAFRTSGAGVPDGQASVRGYREGHVDYGLNEESSAMKDQSYLAKEMAKLRSENERLRRRIDGQQDDLERLEAIEVKTEEEKAKKEAMDKHKNTGKGKSKEDRYKSKKDVHDDPFGAPGPSATEEAAHRAAGVDMRKVIDEFKKPLDDTRSIINEFGAKRSVPTVLEVAQAEAMKDHLDKVAASGIRAQASIDALHARNPEPSKLTRPQRTKFEATLRELGQDKRRLDDQHAALLSKYEGLRDSVLIKTSAELVRTTEAYDKAYDDLIKPKGEGPALERIGPLCLPFTIEKIEEREESRPCARKSDPQRPRPDPGALRARSAHLTPRRRALCVVPQVPAARPRPDRQHPTDALPR